MRIVSHCIRAPKYPLMYVSFAYLERTIIQRHEKDVALVVYNNWDPTVVSGQFWLHVNRSTELDVSRSPVLLQFIWREIFGVLRHMQRYFSHICDGTDVQADWRRSCTYGRAPNAIGISQGSLTCLSYTDTGLPFLYGDSDTPPHIVAGDTEDVFST